jgi:hypothetical protein
LITAAQDLRLIVATISDVRKSTKGDAEATACLRERFVVPDDTLVVVRTREGKTIGSIRAVSRLA